MEPALVLSSIEPTIDYDPGHCPVFPLVQAKLDCRTANFSEFQCYPANEVGLTGGLASLSLKLFVHYERREGNRQLADKVALFMADAGWRPAARVKADSRP